MEHERGEDDDDQRDRAVEDRGDVRIDGLLGGGDQRERDHDVDRRHHEQVEVGLRVPRQLCPADHDHRDQERQANRQPRGDQRERWERLNAELDERVARAPHDPEEAEQEDVGARRAGDHRRSVAATWPSAVGQLIARRDPDRRVDVGSGHGALAGGGLR